MVGGFVEGWLSGFWGGCALAEGWEKRLVDGCEAAVDGCPNKDGALEGCPNKVPCGCVATTAGKTGAEGLLCGAAAAVPSDRPGWGFGASVFAGGAPPKISPCPGCAPAPAPAKIPPPENMLEGWLFFSSGFGALKKEVEGAAAGAVNRPGPEVSADAVLAPENKLPPKDDGAAAAGWVLAGKEGLGGLKPAKRLG